MILNIHKLLWYVLHVYYILVTVSDEYYDSSDGTSDIDEEIDQLETTLQALTAERDRLKQEASRQYIYTGIRYL
jgi:hypothetical protein